MTLQTCSLWCSHRHFQISLGMKMAELLETVYPCHLTQCVRSGRGECPCLNTKLSIFALWGGPSHSAYSGGRLTYVGHCTELFSLTEQSGPDVSRRKWHRKHSDKGGWTLPMLLGKPFLHGLMPITILPTLGNLFLFCVS